MKNNISFPIHLNKVLVKSTVECAECSKCPATKEACKTICTATYDMPAVLDILETYLDDLIKKDAALKSVAHNRLIKKFGSLYKKYQNYLK